MTIIKHINIKVIPNGKWKENCYIVNNKSKDALIIDPGFSEKVLVKYIESNELNVKFILNTHAHYDHIGSIAYLKYKYSIPFGLHSNDKKLLNKANIYSKIFDGDNDINIPDIDYYIDEINIQQKIKSFHIKVIYTPGHTSGSVCYLIGDNLFTGDTLFNGTIGRVDLPGGNEKLLNNSLKQISKLKQSIIIYPGHGATSTIGYELKNNKKFIEAIHIK